MNCEFVEGPVPLNSPFYIRRGAIEESALSEVERPGSLIRIKAPQKMGKGSLLIRMIDRAKNNGCETVTIDFQNVSREIYADLDSFLQWFCLQITESLNLPSLLDEYWDEEIGTKISGNTYLEEYILEAIESPVVLILNHLDRMFDYPPIAQDFLPLLRYWHEQTRQSESLGKLRVIVICATDICVELDVNQSPFNVGLAIDLPPFNVRQIEELMGRHGLSNWNENELSEFQKLTGGKPYLLRLALHRICREGWSLSQVLADGQLRGEIYRQHLQELSALIRENSQLIAPLKNILNTPESLAVGMTTACQLNRIGLVNTVGDRCQISCDLYRHYFSETLL